MRLDLVNQSWRILLKSSAYCRITQWGPQTRQLQAEIKKYICWNLFQVSRARVVGQNKIKWYMENTMAAKKAAKKTAKKAAKKVAKKAKKK